MWGSGRFGICALEMIGTSTASTHPISVAWTRGGWSNFVLLQLARFLLLVGLAAEKREATTSQSSVVVHFFAVIDT